MLDSTARAERIDIPSPEADCYTWEVAQKPIAVRLPLPLIDRLESEAVESFRSLTSRGSEIGGLLLGSAMPGSPAIVTVGDFELVPCDYSRGPLYRLADGDIRRFEQAMERYNHGNGSRVIGYFRSHTRKGLSLDAEDLAFFEPRFLDPQQIVMLIRPFATKVSTAGIFIRENGKFGAETSYREFPFRSSELTMARGGEKSEMSGSTLSAPTAAQPATPPKPQSRAQIVPIASRREITLPEPVVTAPIAPPPVADHVETPAPPAPPAPKVESAAPPAEKIEKDDKEKDKPQQKAAEKEKVAEKEKAAEKEQVSAKEKVPEKEKSSGREKTWNKEKASSKEKSKEKEKAVAVAPLPKAAEPAVEIAIPALAAPEFVEPAKKNKKLRLMVAAALGMIVLGGGGLIVYPSLVKRTPPRPAATAQDSSPLSLRVERTSGGMLLTWNRDLPVIQSATKVVLSISDGDRHENIQLDPNQVRTGSILYPPITGDVSFQMEVTDPRQTKTTSESLRVLDPRPSPLDQPAAAAPAGGKETTPAKSAAVEPAPAQVEEPKPAEEAPVSRPAANLKPFNSASLAQRLRPATSTDLPEAPSLSSAASSAALPGIVTGQPAAPPPPRPVAPQTSNTTAAPSPKVGGQLTSAKVISRVDPEYPKLARQAGASGTVELEATISADGKVKNPRVIRGNTMLQKAAIDAVLQWRYQPALLNGKPVESPVEIKLNFVAQGR